MNRSEKIISYCTSYALLLAAATDGVLLYKYEVSRAQRATSNDAAFIMRDPASPEARRIPDGYLSDGRRAVAPVDISVPGWVVRYSAPGCEYCRAEQPIWRTLQDKLTSKGFSVFVIAPGPHDEYPTSTRIQEKFEQLTFVNAGWAKSFRLTLTPTVMIFTPAKGLIWAHQGEMNDDSVKAALVATNNAVITH